MKSVTKKKFPEKEDAIMHLSKKYNCDPEQLEEAKENRQRWLFRLLPPNAETPEALKANKNSFPDKDADHVKQYREETGADYNSARAAVTAIRNVAQ